MTTHIVNDADDFVICCRATAAEAMEAMRSMMSKLWPTVNETKMRRGRRRGQRVTFPAAAGADSASPSRVPRSDWATRRGRAAPTRDEAVGEDDRGPEAEIGEWTSRRWLWMAVEDRVGKLNRMLLGWSNDFRRGPVSPAYRAIDRPARHRLRQ